MISELIVVAGFGCAAWLDHERQTRRKYEPRLREKFTSSEESARQGGSVDDTSRALRFLWIGTLTFNTTVVLDVILASQSANHLPFTYTHFVLFVLVMTVVSCLILSMDDIAIGRPQRIQFSLADLWGAFLGLALGFGVAHVIFVHLVQR